MLDYWQRRKWWTTTAALVGSIAVLAGGLLWLSEYRANNELAETGDVILAEVYEAPWADVRI